jgi:hypothetical protein
MHDVDAALRITESFLHHLQRQSEGRPDLKPCIEALKVVLDRAKRHDLMRAATAERVVRLDDVSRRLRRAIRALAITASELRRLGATEAAGLIEAADRGAVRAVPGPAPSARSRRRRRAEGAGFA